MRLGLEKESTRTDNNQLERRLVFHLARKPQNGFQAMSIDSSAKRGNVEVHQPIKAIQKNINELFDPNHVESHLRWNQVRRIGPGLYNAGNSCYLNSTLQCLLYTAPLTQLLLSKDVEVMPKTSSSGHQAYIVAYYQR
jgi:ubiquitin C-terminal hydrolase